MITRTEPYVSLSRAQDGEHHGLAFVSDGLVATGDFTLEQLVEIAGRITAYVAQQRQAGEREHG